MSHQKTTEVVEGEIPTASEEDKLEVTLMRECLLEVSSVVMAAINCKRFSHSM
jgi:hypothetical protein